MSSILTKITRRDEAAEKEEEKGLEKTREPMEEDYEGKRKDALESVGGGEMDRATAKRLRAELPDFEGFEGKSESRDTSGEIMQSSPKKDQGGENLAEEIELPEGRPSKDQMREIVDRYYEVLDELERTQEEFKKVKEIYQKAVENSMEVGVEVER